MPSLRCGAVVVAALFAGLVTAQLPNPEPTKVVGARSLAISPDGDRLAFVYRGDIWVSPSDGGRATRLTSHVEFDDTPLWSPDGQWIAFRSNRNGGNDIYAIPAEGGQTIRLTYHPGGVTPTSWSADGRFIYFTASREKPNPGIYGVDVTTLELKEVLLDFQPIGSPVVMSNGNEFVYTRLGFPWVRPRYEGARAAQLWLLDAQGRRVELRNNGFQHLWPQIGHDGRILVITVEQKTRSVAPVGQSVGRIEDNERKTPNVYQIDRNGRATRLTNFVGGGVRFLTAASNAPVVAFERDGAVYKMQFGEAPREVNIVATVDDKFTQITRDVVTNGAGAVALSPDHATFAFVARDEVWSVPVQQGTRPNDSDARRITDWVGIDGNPIWHPNGRSIYFTSDREGSERLYRYELETSRTVPITRVDHDVTSLRVAPNNRFINFWLTGSDGGLMQLDTRTDQVTRVFERPGNFRGFTDYAWSPDMRYVAYLVRAPGAVINQQSRQNVWIYDTQTREHHNVTRINAFHNAPAFSADGKFLYYVSDRQQSGIFRVPLQPLGFREQDQDLTYTRAEGNVQVEIDFSGIEHRATLHTSSGLVSNLRFDPTDGYLYYSSGGQVSRVSYDGRRTETITSGDPIGPFEFDNDYERLIYSQGGLPRIMMLRRPNRPVTSVNFRAEFVRDLREVRHAAFMQLWRTFNRAFYDPDFHGRDWVAIRDRYEPLLDSVEHPAEMALVLDMMVHELEASHTEVRGGGGPSGISVAHPGFTFDYSHRGPGIRVLEVPDRTPGSLEATRINPGEYVLKINGKDVRLTEHLYRDVLSGQIGRDMTFTVNSEPTLEGAREVRYVALSDGAFNGIIRENEIRARRAYVEERSGGRLTYIEIPAMSGGALAQFNFEAWEFIDGKEGVIIDVRRNGGGNIADMLIDMIEREPHAYYVDRDGNPVFQPENSWNRPTAVLISETSASNAEMFPNAMKSRGLGTIIGMPTPGYVIWTTGLGLVDGTSARLPGAGVFRMDGSPMENNGEQPNIRVWNDPVDVLNGKDDQLDRAIEYLLRRLG